MNANIRRVLVLGGTIAVFVAILFNAGAGAAPPDKDVTVVNTPAEPVPVAATPTKEPFQTDTSVLIPSGQLSETNSFTVPADKRLVIEYASGSTRVADEEVARVTITTTVGGNLVDHELAPSVIHHDYDDPAITDDFLVTYGEMVRIYADPGSTVTVTATRSENIEATPTFFLLAVSGHLVDCGPTPGCPIP